MHQLKSITANWTNIYQLLHLYPVISPNLTQKPRGFIPDTGTFYDKLSIIHNGNTTLSNI